MKKFFVGIDFSKKTMDASIVSKGEPGNLIAHKKFPNSEAGAQAMLQWTADKTHGENPAGDDYMYCGEHTGSYCTIVADYLSGRGCYLWLGNPLDIKRSIGLVRGKDDKVDSLRIATYAATMEYKSRRYMRLSDASRVLRMLLKLRGELVEDRKRFRVIKSESFLNLENKLQQDSLDSIQDSIMATLDEKICQVEKQIHAVIETIEEMKIAFAVLTSMKGIGLINAVAIMCMTDNFKKFDYNNRLAAAYWGVVPYRNESGTSIRKGTHTNRICNGWLRATLTEAALCAIKYNDRMKAYYERLLKRGKHRNVALNNVKNKMIRTLVAMVRDCKQFDPEFKSKAPKPKCA